MKATQIYIIIMSMAALAFTSCVKDELHDTPHPETGKIAVTADWAARGAGIDIPASWSVTLGDYAGTETGETHTPDYLFEPGGYTLIAYNPAADITVNGTTATVATTADGLLSPNPSWLFTSVQEVSIEADKDHTFTAAMQQQVRQLTLTIRPQGDSAPRITGLECTLTGVAGSMNFATDTYGNESLVPLHFTKITEGENAGAWTATVYLLGIVGERQYLSGYVTFEDGNPQPMFIESDMTEVFNDPDAPFNGDKADPKILSTSTEVPAQAGVTATINDWTVVTSDPVEAM